MFWSAEPVADGLGEVPVVPVADGFDCSLPLVPTVRVAPLAAVAGFAGFDVVPVAVDGGIEPAADPDSADEPELAEPVVELAEPVDVEPVVEPEEPVEPAEAEVGSAPPADFSNSFRCVLNSTSFPRIAGSSWTPDALAPVGAAPVPVVPAAPAVPVPVVPAVPAAALVPPLWL